MANAAAPVLVIATSELPPYVSAQPQNSFLTELLQEVGKEMGVSFELRFMPWVRCEIAVSSLDVWAAVPYVPTPKRMQSFLFSQPLYAKRTVLFHYSANGQLPPKKFQDLSELAHYKVGGVRGYYYESLFTKAGIQLEISNTEETNFKKLKAGRIDMVAAIDTVGWNEIRKSFSPEQQMNIHVLNPPIAVGDNYLMTSRHYPNSQQLLERFNLALATLRDTGAYEKIAERYGLFEN